MIFVVKKLLLIFVLSCWSNAFAQNRENKFGEYGSHANLETFRGNKNCRISESSCRDVIELLRVSQENDSIAIDIFKKEYEITNMRQVEKEWLLLKNHIGIILYFTLKGNEKYHCQSKRFKRYDTVLLLE